MAVGRFSYPVFLDLHDVPVLVVGGGPVGWRKASGLAAAGARVRLVARAVAPIVDPLEVDEVHERAFRPADLDGVHLVVAATGDQATDAAIADAARSRRIWVNVADQPVDCGFILPAIARVGRVSVAVSTDGASPALAQHLRDRIAAQFLDDRVADAAERLSAERQSLRRRGASTEDVEWGGRLRELLGEHPAPLNDA